MTDERKLKVGNDPRFIRPKKKESKVKIDSRFKKMFHDDEFSLPCPVDKYGRKKTFSKKENLKRFYHLEEDQTSEEEESVPLVDLRGNRLTNNAVSSSSDDTSENDTSDIGESTEEDILTSNPHSKKEDIPSGNPTHRLAVVNMDWDQLRAEDILHVLNSFKPKLGKVQSVKIYPSQFGKERMEQEQRFGPPASIFKPYIPNNGSSDQNEQSSEEEDVGLSSSDDDQVTEEKLMKEEMEGENAAHTDMDKDIHILEPEESKDFDDKELKKYQLERLRYYYAVVECDSIETAKKIYEDCDGREFEKSCNLIDLRYIPDSVSFEDDEPLQIATTVSTLYKPNEFNTHVLQHSKAKLTWDEDDPHRIKITKKRFDKETLDEMDFKAYMASSGSDSDDQSKTNGIDDDIIQKYKLLVNAQNEGSVFKNKSEDENEDDIDMEVTFTSALNEDSSEAERENETVFHTTLRKQREKKRSALKALEQEKAELESSNNSRISKDKSKDNDKKISELELLLIDENTKSSELRKHFNLKDIIKNEKSKGAKSKSKAVIGGIKEQGPDFEMNMDDPRFSAVFDTHQFTIDPSNPAFKPTKNMKKLLEVKRNRTKNH